MPARCLGCHPLAQGAGGGHLRRHVDEAHHDVGHDIDHFHVEEAGTVSGRNGHRFEGVRNDGVGTTTASPMTPAPPPIAIHILAR